MRSARSAYCRELFGEFGLVSGHIRRCRLISGRVLCGGLVSGRVRRSQLCFGTCSARFLYSLDVFGEVGIV